MRRGLATIVLAAGAVLGACAKKGGDAEAAERAPQCDRIEPLAARSV
jgi:hypothetical protein